LRQKVGGPRNIRVTLVTHALRRPRLAARQSRLAASFLLREPNTFPHQPFVARKFAPKSPPPRAFLCIEAAVIGDSQPGFSGSYF
jgi:hypothetical protein